MDMHHNIFNHAKVSLKITRTGDCFLTILAQEKHMKIKVHALLYRVNII